LIVFTCRIKETTKHRDQGNGDDQRNEK